jgi:hypothetical protein
VPTWTDGVAKFYKEVVNAEVSPLFFQFGESVEKVREVQHLVCLTALEFAGMFPDDSSNTGP